MQIRLRIPILMALLAVTILDSTSYGASSTVVISQIYSAQNPNSRVRRDYIELFNLGTTAVNLSGWTLQIAVLNNPTWEAIPLSGNIEPGQYYLVSGRTNTEGRDLPPADLTTTVALEIEGGRVALASDSNVYNGNSCPTSQSNLVDFISYGSSVCQTPTAPLDATHSLMRALGGCRDTDTSGSDISLFTPTPRNRFTARNVCNADLSASTRNFAIPNNGGTSFTTDGAGSSLRVGSARIESLAGSPSGIAIFGYRQGANLVSEASVPAAPLMTSALIYVEVASPIDTGIAITNPNNTAVTITFSYNDSYRGYFFPTDFGELTIPPRGQIAAFIGQLPFGLTGTRFGTVELSSPEPIGVIALRGFTNERSEFLVTTLPVMDLSARGSRDPSYIAHFAVDGGWRTQVVLVNSSSDAVAGTIEFRDRLGAPASFTFSGTQHSSIAYSIPAKNAFTVNLPSVATSETRAGSLRVTLSSGISTPTALAVFSYKNNNVTVSEAGLVGNRGSRFRTYVEASGVSGTNGSIQSGLAITNDGSTTATVTLELRRLDGTLFGSTTVTVPGNGQIAKFLNELFPSVTGSLQGVLRITTSDTIGVVGLRTRYNERNDFLITTVPAADEQATVPSTGIVFPHIADSGGYTTQFILYGATGTAITGNLVTMAPGGVPLALTFR